MIDLTIHPETLNKTIERARQQKLFMPTFEMMKNPELIPDEIKNQLSEVGLWDINPLNLARITWKNEPVLQGGGFGGVNFLEVPKEPTRMVEK